MTHRDRVLAALNHEEPDSVPVDFGSTFATTINIGAYEKLKEHLGLNTPTRMASLRSLVAEVEGEVLQRFDIDTRGVMFGAPDHSQFEQFPDGSYRDEWGIVRRRAEQGHFLDVGHPFAGEPTEKDVERHDWFDPDDPGITRGVREKAERLRKETDCAVVLNLPVGVISQTQFLRGYAEWMMDAIANPVFFDALAGRVTDLWTSMTGNLIVAAGGNIDLVFVGDDIAIQTGPLMSHDLYLKRMKPWQRRMFEFIRSRTKAKILYHSCGSVYSLIPDLIDMGIDALNPVQVAAKDMDTARLKREFGERLAFWGAIDTQHVLPHGTPDDVRAEVRRRIRDLASGGGYVVNSVHNIQREVPPENVCALFEATRESRGD